MLGINFCKKNKSPQHLFGELELVSYHHSIVAMLTSSSLIWIKACTDRAIAFPHVRSTTVSTIPFTSTIVVSIITPVITLPTLFTTGISAWSCSIWIKTCTYRAIFFIYVRSTTISTIPFTSTIVVFIITIPISFPTLMLTSACATTLCTAWVSG